MNDFEIGLYTLGDYVSDPKTGHIISEKERIEQIIGAAKVADAVGLDVFSVGESHQEHFISQAHALILAAIARETTTIRISSSATILSTSDPVRVYENFATLDILSNGRAEIVAGRASRLGLFDLLGFDVKDYEALFEEKFELLLRLNQEAKVTWQGTYRKPLNNAVLYPKPLQEKLPIWRAVGGPAYSARIAGKQGVAMMLATLMGPIAHFNQTVQTYRQSFQHYHETLDAMKLGITSFCHIADTDEQALRNFYQYANHSFKQSNGHGLSKEGYATVLDMRNAMIIGSPETVINKLVYQYEVYKHDRHLLQIDLGGMPYDQIITTIETLGRVIVPEVKRRIRANQENSQ